MFSINLTRSLSDVGIDHRKGHYHVRTTLEDMLDDTAKYINTERHSEYAKVEEIYSMYMEDFNAYLDLKDGINNI